MLYNKKEPGRRGTDPIKICAAPAQKVREQKLREAQDNEGHKRMEVKRMNITIAIGKYTPSYFHMLKEQGMNPTAGWTCRLADGQVDDTCFDVGVTFYELRDALKALTDHSDAEFNAVLSEAVIYAYQIKEGIVQNPFEPDKERGEMR